MRWSKYRISDILPYNHHTVMTIPSKQYQRRKDQSCGKSKELQIGPQIIFAGRPTTLSINFRKAEVVTSKPLLATMMLTLSSVLAMFLMAARPDETIDSSSSKRVMLDINRGIPPCPKRAEHCNM